ncbi:MAG: helix-turn-helix transcriptional regulator [Sphingobium sp.]
MGSRGHDCSAADAFLSAALEPHLWDEALRAMAAATGSAHGQLIGFGAGAGSFNWISDIDQSIVAKSSALDIASPDLNFRVAADRLPDRPYIVHEGHYDIVRQTSLRADDYLDLCAEYDIFEGCQTRLLEDRDKMIGLALLRDSKDGRTTEAQRKIFAELAAHAGVAVRLQQAMEKQGFALLSGTFEAMDRICWLLDGSGRVGGMTPRAETLLSQGRVRVEDGWLAGQGPEENRHIGRAIRAVVGEPTRIADPVALVDEDGSVAIMLDFYPLPARPWSLPFAPRAVVIARLAAPTSGTAVRLVRAFRLTPAEADIAIRLAGGMSRRDIAGARGVSAETLKVQIRSIYEKTGCNRESQLVRMLALLGD